MIALDLFAGTGWGVACQRLGIEEYGVEIMPEARAVRAANRMKTWYADVWQGLEADVRRFDSAAFFDIYDLLIASPPCQTFSMAGGGAGRRALDEVVDLIDKRAYLNVEALRAFGEAHDPRTALVLTPLAYVARDVPLHVVLEQVPPVLPVWERYAVEMRKWGYSVWTGIVNAEQHGVPQTRKRAILIARADGVEAAPPTPTHSKYYPRDPERLDEGVMPWVSMAEALGWDQSGGTSGSRAARIMRSNYSAGGEGTAAERGRTLREDDKPSLAMTGKPGHWVRPSYTVTGGGAATGGAEPFGRRARANMPEEAQRVTVEEASALQSYPDGFDWHVMVPDGKGGAKPITKTKQFLQIGNAVPPLMAEAILRAAIEGSES